MKISLIDVFICNNKIDSNFKDINKQHNLIFILFIYWIFKINSFFTIFNLSFVNFKREKYKNPL